jgi:hypothetical protein
LRRCIRERLVGGEDFVIDASLIKADANRRNGIEGDKGLFSRRLGAKHRRVSESLDDVAFGAATEIRPKFRLVYMGTSSLPRHFSVAELRPGARAQLVSARFL